MGWRNTLLGEVGKNVRWMINYVVSVLNLSCVRGIELISLTVNKIFAWRSGDIRITEATWIKIRIWAKDRTLGVTYGQGLGMREDGCEETQEETVRERLRRASYVIHKNRDWEESTGFKIQVSQVALPEQFLLTFGDK